VQGRINEGYNPLKIPFLQKKKEGGHNGQALGVIELVLISRIGVLIMQRYSAK